MNVRLLVRLLLGMFAASAAFAAENVPEFNSRIWQSEEGLPLDNAQTVTQTGDGFLWIGTQQGLARFDGARFTVFDPKNTPELKSANVRGLCEDHAGNLWIATDLGGLTCCKNGHFTHYGIAEGLADNACLGALFCSADGTMWIATREGLCRFKNNHFTTMTSTNGLSSSEVRGMCEDQNGTIWFATARGVDGWKDDHFIVHFNKFERPGDKPTDDTRTILCDRQGTIWVAAGNILYQLKDGKPELFASEQSGNYNLLIKLFEDRQGNLWAGTYDGLSRVKGNTFRGEWNNGRQSFGKINDIYQDQENNIWLCIRDGLVRLKANRIRCFTQEQGLANNIIMSVIENHEGQLCVGTWGGSLNIITGDKIYAHTNEPGFPTLIAGLCEDRGGRLWIGTDYRGGLYEMEGKELRHFDGNAGTQFPSIRVLCEDREKNLWIGTSSGLYFRWGNRLNQYRADTRLQNADIRALKEDAEGNLWVGTMNGLARMKDHSIVWFNTTNGLSSDSVMSICEDELHNIWVGTAGAGLNRYQNGKFTAYTKRQGLFSDNIYEILIDDAHWIWMGSERGIFRLKRKSLDELDAGLIRGIHCVSYGKTDGMMNNICTSVSKPAACKSRDGRLWFATVKGLCAIDPRKEDILPESTAPPVVLEEILADRQVIPSSARTGNAISLEPGHGELEFHYAALSFFEPENNHYKYKLEGVDSDWVDAGSRPTAHYNNIYPGHYTFHVIACNGDGIWNETGATLGLIMLPHFWQQWWFLPAMVLVGFAFLYLAWRIRLERKAEIERLRLHIAADLHDEIGSNLASISLLSQLSPADIDEAERAELLEINRIALATATSIREIVWFINPDNDSLPEMILRMKEVAGQMLSGFNYSFEATSVPTKTRLPLQMRRNIFLVYKEILHNIVKHSRAEHVAITFNEHRGTMILRVADDGRGIDLVSGRRGNGLKNMRLRAEKMGGKLTVASTPGNGTVLSLSVGIP